MKIICIGDVHGKTKQYQKMIRQKFSDKTTFQLGDMGIGFKGVGLHQMDPWHFWFRGNHDNPQKCREAYNYLGDYGYLPNLYLFWTAGALSIDRAFRTEGVSWWADEELSYEELGKAIDLYVETKPRYVLSHEAPRSAAIVLLSTMQGEYADAKGDCANSRTAQALESMFQEHQPEEWVFGHYHVSHSFAVPYKNTKFTCVPELGTYELEIKNGGSESSI